MASYSMIVTALLLCGFLGHTNSQGNVPDTDKNVYKIFNVWDTHNLKITGVSNPISNNPDVTAIPAFKQIKNVLKPKCDKNGSAGAFEKVDRAMYEITECIQNFVGMGQQSEEMERYALNKDLHLVFKNYCRNTPVFKKCVSNFTVAIEPCLDPQEKDSIKVIENVIDALLSFICFKDGDHIVQFISAHGPECVQSKQQEILQCVISTLQYHSPPPKPNNGSSAGLDRLPLVTFGAENCANVTTIQGCIVKKLEECSDPTPANFVDSIFNVILQATPCKEFLTDRSAASTSTINSLAASIVFLVLRLI